MYDDLVTPFTFEVNQLNDQIQEIKYEFSHLESFLRERVYKFNTLRELEQVKDFEYNNLSEELLSIITKNENLRKIIDLMEIESQDTEQENKFMFEKFGAGKEVQDNLKVYEFELTNRATSLQHEVESLRRIVDKKRNLIEERKKSGIQEKDKEISEVNQEIEDKTLNKIEYEAKIHNLKIQIQKKMEILNGEREQGYKVAETNMLYSKSIIEAEGNSSNLQDDINYYERETGGLKKDIIQNSISYEKLKVKVELLLKKISTVNKNNLNMANFIETSIKSLEDKKKIVDERNEKLDNAVYYKNKVIQSLKEISTMKKYLTMSQIKEDNLDENKKEDQNESSTSKYIEANDRIKKPTFDLEDY